MVVPEWIGGWEVQGDDEKSTCRGLGLEVFDRRLKMKEGEMGESEGMGLLLGVLWT